MAKDTLYSWSSKTAQDERRRGREGKCEKKSSPRRNVFPEERCCYREIETKAHVTEKKPSPKQNTSMAFSCIKSQGEFVFHLFDWN